MNKSKSILVLLVILAAITLSGQRNQYIHEYYLYLTETRPSASFEFTKLSEAWTENDLRANFKGLIFRCYDNRPGEYLDDRSCFADVSALNGQGAMSLAFYFKDRKLNRAAVNVPWWSHRSTMQYLTSSYGEPMASQSWPRDGVRLHGWELANHSALFFNRDMPINPIRWSGIFWSSARQCGVETCFRTPIKRPRQNPA